LKFGNTNFYAMDSQNISKKQNTSKLWWNQVHSPPMALLVKVLLLKVGPYRLKFLAGSWKCFRTNLKFRKTLLHL
jgi:hypothetical protein